MINGDPKLKLLNIFTIEEVRIIYMGKELLVTNIDTNWGGFVPSLKYYLHKKILVNDIQISHSDKERVYFRMKNGNEFAFLETYFDFNFSIQERVIL